MHIQNVQLRLDGSELVTCCLEEALDIGAETAHRLALREKAQGMTAQVATDGSHLQQALGNRARSYDLISTDPSGSGRDPESSGAWRR